MLASTLLIIPHSLPLFRTLHCALSTPAGFVLVVAPPPRRSKCCLKKGMGEPIERGSGPPKGTPTKTSYMAWGGGGRILAVSSRLFPAIHHHLWAGLVAHFGFTPGTGRVLFQDPGARAPNLPIGICRVRSWRARAHGEVGGQGLAVRGQSKQLGGQCESWKLAWPVALTSTPPPPDRHTTT